jgi:filamentous hemagglutinin
MAQQYIDFGTFPNDPAADPIRAAFQKIQTNFTELYNTTQSTGVNEVVVQLGLTQNRTTGNIIITGAFPNITVQTSNSLLVGIGAATGNSATISSYTQKINLNLANTITTQNAVFTTNTTTSNLQVGNFVTSSLAPNANITYDLGGVSNRWRAIYLNGTNGIALGSQNITANSTFITVSNLNVSGTIFASNISIGSNITVSNANVTSTLVTNDLLVTGSITGNLIPNADSTINLGSPTRKFKDLFLSGNTLTLGTSTISTTPGGGISIPSGVVTSNISAGNVSATYVGGTLTSSSQPAITSVGVLSNLSVAGDIASGNLTVVGNLQTANITTTGTIVATNIQANIVPVPGQPVVLAAPGNSTQIMFNDNGNSAAVPGLTFDKTSNLLSIQGNVSGGNLTTSGGISATGSANIGGNLISGGAMSATGNVTGGNLITLGILSASAGITSGGNISTTGFLSVFGNASVGNITTTTVSGQTVTVSGNVSGANLIATGIMRVDGNANVGNLTTTGIVSAATLAAANANVTGNSIVGGNHDVTGNISGGNLTTGGDLNVSGNANVANLIAATLSATGNMSAGNLSTGGSLAAGSASVTGNSSVGGTHTAVSYTHLRAHETG